MSFPVSEDALVQLDAWPKGARALLDELLEDAGSDLQREFIVRAIAAGHTPPEVHAFADELRAMNDDEAYHACTLHDAPPEDFTVAQLLRAESDPLFAFEAQGGTIEPNETLDVTPPPPESAISAPSLDPVVAALSRKKASFEADSRDLLHPKVDWGELPSALPATAKPERDAGPTTRFLEGLLNDATRVLQLTWKESEIDLPGGLSLSDAVASALGALTRGIPLAAVIGPRAGDHRRFIAILQTNTSGKNRAWQLYDPTSGELLWANENDLLAGNELPFANKANRRLTRIVLPRNFR